MTSTMEADGWYLEVIWWYSVMEKLTDILMFSTEEAIVIIDDDLMRG